MIRLDWNNPKITIADLELFLSNYLGSKFDGIVINETTLDVMSSEALSSEEEDYIKDWFYSLNDVPKEVQSISDLVCAWACTKNFYDLHYPSCSMHYFEKQDRYYVWVEYREQKFYLPNLMKETSDCVDFETNYKARCNVHEAVKVRITTCKVGRKLHDRYVSFTTADQDNFDNTDFNNDSYGDFTYKMYKWVNDERVLTTTNSEAEETWLDFEPAWDFEISSGSIDIPATLSGSDDNSWELHTIGVPDIPKIYGGTVDLIANPKLKFKKGKSVTVDSSMHPAEMLYSATLHTNKIRFIIMHPAGAQSEFQINLKLYK